MFRILFMLLDGMEPAELLAELRAALEPAGAHSRWDIATMIAHVRPRLSVSDAELVEAMAGAINDKAKVGAIEKWMAPRE